MTDDYRQWLSSQPIDRIPKGHEGAWWKLRSQRDRRSRFRRHGDRLRNEQKMPSVSMPPT